MAYKGREYASVQFDVPQGSLYNELAKCRKSIQGVRKEEDEPHITVFYGLAPDVDVKELEGLIKGFGAFWSKMGKPGRFQIGRKSGHILGALPPLRISEWPAKPRGDNSDYTINSNFGEVKQMGGWIDPTAETGDWNQPDDSERPCDVLWIGQSIPNYRTYFDENPYKDTDGGYGSVWLPNLYSQKAYKAGLVRMHDIFAKHWSADQELASRPYIPHLTMAYVNPEAHPGWEDERLSVMGRHVLVDSLTLSRPDSAVTGNLKKLTKILL